jgi:hypothetical protein
MLTLGGCGADESADVESEVAARFAAFPSDAQRAGTPAWPEGRFADDCAAEAEGTYLCFYEDARGRQGYVCFAPDSLEIVQAAGAHDPRRRFDHEGRALPPAGRCPSGR